jgi:hypothetical protein
VRTKDGVSRFAYGGFAYGVAESFPIFRTSWESLDRRQLSDTPFHRTPDTHCLRKGRSLYNARREQAVYCSFQAYRWFSSTASLAVRQLRCPCHGAPLTTSARRYLGQLQPSHSRPGLPGPRSQAQGSAETKHTRQPAAAHHWSAGCPNANTINLHVSHQPYFGACSSRRRAPCRVLS